MALRDHHLKVAFMDGEILDGLDERPEDYTLGALFNFVAKAVRSYDYVDWSQSKIFIEMNQSEVDFIVFSTLVTEKSWNKFSLNYPYSFDDITYVTRKPEYSPEMMSLFQTLSLNVWLLFLASVVLVSLVTFVVMKHRRRLVDIIFHVVAIVLNQNGNLVPRRVGEVLLLTTWAVAMTFFTFCFKSVLLSFLTFPPLNGVKTVPELAAAIRAGTYRAFTVENNPLPKYLMLSPNRDVRSIGESMLKSPRRFVEYILEHRSNEAVVFLRSYLSFMKEELYLSKDSMGPVYIATAVGKGFCCKDEMDMLIHRFLASGIDQKIERFRYHRSIWLMYLWPRRDSGETRKFTLTDFSGALIFLAVGHCLSVIVLIVECMSKRRASRQSLTRRN